MTTTDDLEKKIRQEKARLQLMEARLSEQRRKDRTGQLVAGGVLLEQIFMGESSPEKRQTWLSTAQLYLGNNPRMMKRLEAMFVRLDLEYPIKPQ